MLSNAQIEKFDRDGYTLGGPVLSAPEVDELRDEMQRVIANHGRTDLPQPVALSNLGRQAGKEVWQIVNIWNASEAFRRVVMHPAIVEAAARLIRARQLRVWHDQIQYKPASTGGVNMWHQDCPYWPCLTPKDVQVTAWVALDDVDPDNGCMSMVPGSHLWGNQADFLHTLKQWEDMPPSWNGHDLAVVPCPVAKGGVHFHHSLTWHGSPSNISGRPRRALAIHYMTERTCYEPTSQHPMRKFIHVQPGAMVEGDAFPLLWDHGTIVKPVALASA